MRRRATTTIVAAAIAIVAVAAAAAIVAVQDHRSHGSSGSATTAPGASPAVPANGFPTSRGVYVVEFFQSPSQALLDAKVDGFFQAYKWASIEPRAGAFNWTRLNSDLAKIKSAGKKAAVGIEAGTFTPTWAEPQRDTFVIAAKMGKTGQCKEITVPFPWNATYQSNLRSMMRSLHDDLVARGLYDTVTQIKLTGINEDTAETRMPAELDNITCSTLKRLDGSELNPAPAGTRTTNAVEKWKADGYTRALAEHAWETIAGDWAAQFPDKTLAAPIIKLAAFPAIDGSGNVTSGKDTTTTRDLYTWASKQWGKRFMLMENSLSDRFKTTEAQEANRSGASIGFQLNDVGYGRNGTLAPVSSFQQAVGVGLRYHMSYLEIFTNDAAPYSSAVAQAHSQILAG